jgi:hypothetical protein
LGAKASNAISPIVKRVPALPRGAWRVESAQA